MYETPGADANPGYVPVATTEDGNARAVYYNEEEMEALGCGGRVTAEEHKRIKERMNKRGPPRRFAVAIVGAVMFSLFFLYIYAMCVDLPESLYIYSNYQDIKHLNHTTKAMSKDMKEYDAEITGIQDYLVAEYFDPCASAKCRSQRLLDMFGGELPAKYQHYLMEQGMGRAK